MADDVHQHQDGQPSSGVILEASSAVSVVPVAAAEPPVEHPLTGRLRELKKGEQLIYHVGYLARDREKSPSLHYLAAEALDGVYNGRLAVYQRRSLTEKGKSQFTYIVMAIEDDRMTLDNRFKMSAVLGTEHEYLNDDRLDHALAMVGKGEYYRGVGLLCRERDAKRQEPFFYKHHTFEQLKQLLQELQVR